jgi:hypothetical protein
MGIDANVGKRSGHGGDATCRSADVRRSANRGKSVEEVLT